MTQSGAQSADQAADQLVARSKDPSPDRLPDRLMAKALGDAMRDQQLRQERMRHVQEFLSSPSFVDLRDAPLFVSDDAAALSARRADLTYRIGVLQSVLALLTEERDLIDRAQPAEAGTGPESGPDVASDSGPDSGPALGPDSGLQTQAEARVAAVAQSEADA